MSQDQGRYGKEQEHEMDLPVPKYSGSQRITGSRSLSDVDKSSAPLNIYDNIFGEMYNSSERSDSPSSGNSQVQEGYASISTTSNNYHNYQRGAIQSHGSNLASHSNANHGMSAPLFSLQHYTEISTKQPQRSRTTILTHGHCGVKKDVAGQTVTGGHKVPQSKQIQEYKKKATLLRQQLETLKDQRNELRGYSKRSPSPDTKRCLKENTKLQLEVQNKLKTINNVLDMMNGIIGDHSDVHELRSPEEKPKQKWCQKFNYEFYDPELHWCRVCDVFPQTAKEYLNHLHSPEHQTTAAEHEEAPWHNVSINAGYPSLPGAPTKRTPIRGLQFFVPAIAWYCKLCDQFIGDLHCASAHMKSIEHSKNYNKFVQQNPHWETDWVSDRQRAFERSREAVRSVNDGPCLKQQLKYVRHTVTISKDMHTKRPPKTPPLELEDRQRQVKRRKPGRSSSLSSFDDSASESTENTRRKNKKLISVDLTDSLDDFDSPTPTSVLTDEDRRVLETLRDRMRKKDEMRRSTSKDEERIRELQRKIIDSESRGRSCERRLRSRSRSGDRGRYRAVRRRGSRERSDRRKSRDRRDASRERTPASRDRRGGSRDRRGGSRDRRGGIRDRRGGSRDRRDSSRDKRGGSRERRDVSRIGQNDSQIAESKVVATSQPPLPPPLQLPTLPMPTAAMPPVPAAVPPVPAVMPPVPTAIPPVPAVMPPAPAVMPPVPAAMPPPMMIPPQSLLSDSIPTVPKEFQEALEMLFPTDPTKCTEMLNAMQVNQKPGILGPPPGLPLAFPYGFPPATFPYDLNATVQSLLHTNMPHRPPIRTPHRRARNNQNQHTQNRKKQQTPAIENRKPTDKRSSAEDKDMNDFKMLGIDSSDVGAGS